MRVLILGGSGMLGHKLWQNLRERFDAYVTFRQSPPAYERFRIFDPARSVGHVSAQVPRGERHPPRTERPETIECGSNMLSGADPEAVLRCVRTVLDRKPEWEAPPEYLARNVSSTVTRLLLGYRHAA